MGIWRPDTKGGPDVYPFRAREPGTRSDVKPRPCKGGVPVRLSWRVGVPHLRVTSQWQAPPPRYPKGHPPPVFRHGFTSETILRSSPKKGIGRGDPLGTNGRSTPPPCLSNGRGAPYPGQVGGGGSNSRHQHQIPYPGTEAILNPPISSATGTSMPLMPQRSRVSLSSSNLQELTQEPAQIPEDSPATPVATTPATKPTQAPGLPVTLCCIGLVIACGLKVAYN